MEDEYAVLSTNVASGKSPLTLPNKNHLFAYTIGRAMHFWPEVNGNNNVWLEEDIKPLYDDESAHKLTFTGTLVDLDHNEPIVVGSTIEEKYIPGVGIDVLTKLDRRHLERLQLNADEFAANGDYCKQSVEINCDRSKSKFIVMLNPTSKNLAEQRIYTADEAAALGIRRTSIADPLGEYYFEGKFKVLEASYPRGVRGIALLCNPADSKATIFDVAASDETLANLGDESKNNDVRAAHNQLSGEKHMTAEELAAKLDPLNADIAKLRSEIKDKEDESSALSERVDLKDKEIAAHLDTIKAKDDEIATLKSQIAEIKSEEIAKERLAKLSSIDGFAIKDEEKAGLIESLRAESEAEFANRVLKAENASLAAKFEALKSGKKPEENAGLDRSDERAALEAIAGIDANAAKGKPTYESLFAK